MSISRVASRLKEQAAYIDKSLLPDFLRSLGFWTDSEIKAMVASATVRASKHLVEIRTPTQAADFATVVKAMDALPTLKKLKRRSLDAFVTYKVGGLSDRIFQVYLGWKSERARDTKVWISLQDSTVPYEIEVLSDWQGLTFDRSQVVLDKTMFVNDYTESFDRFAEHPQMSVRIHRELTKLGVTKVWVVPYTDPSSPFTKIDVIFTSKPKGKQIVPVETVRNVRFISSGKQMILTG